jgi:isopentenyl phosphate kinase
VRTVLKLGGSVVTAKDTPETVDEQHLAVAADAVAGALGSPPELVVVHGGGSFGHHHASRHGVTTADGTHDAAAINNIHTAMKSLNSAVVDALTERGIPAVPVHPLSAGSRDEVGELSFPPNAVRTLLDEGFVPVTHGDVVAHRGRGATIVSGDELVVSLAAGVGADRVGLCSDVPGVLDDDDDVIDRIESFDEVSEFLGASGTTDVTGGMATKVRELLALGAPAQVFDLAGLERFLDGGDPGTRVG